MVYKIMIFQKPLPKVQINRIIELLSLITSQSHVPNLFVFSIYLK